jgi:phage terminase small subunit
VAESKAPAHLRPATKAWWASVVADYEFEPHHIRLLTLAGEAWDMGELAQKGLKKADSLVFFDRFGSPHARPEVAIARDSRIAFARLLRELALDVEPPKSPGRPPGLGGRN